jgi:hypothetical protein
MKIRAPPATEVLAALEHGKHLLDDHPNGAGSVCADSMLIHPRSESV